MNEKLSSMDISTIWEINKDLSLIMSRHDPEVTDKVFLFWYEVWKAVEGEIDKRLASEY